MGKSKDNPGVDDKTGAATTDTRNFIETHHVTKLARRTVPASGEESADLLQDDQEDEVGRS